jgi:hypothetical protein
MKTSSIFDTKIAKKYGVEDAIVFELLDNLCHIQKAMGRDKMYRNGFWWCKCPDEVFDQFLPFVNVKKRQKILARLLRNELIQSEEGQFTTNLQDDDDKKSKNKVEIKKVDNDDRIFTFSKMEDGEMKHFEVPGSKLVAMLIHEFQYVNPDYKKFYAQKAQRNALLEMTESYAPEMMFQMLEIIPRTNVEKFAPQIFSPMQFKNKAAQLITFIRREGNDNNGFVL